MLLGTLIKHAMRAQGPFAEEIACRDAELAARIETEGSRRGLGSRDFIADTVRRFMEAEDAESWTTVMNGIQCVDDPGMAFLEAVMRMRLSHQCGH